MLDWDGDGKDTWKDDYIYHEVFNTEKSNIPHDAHRWKASEDGKVIRVCLWIVVLWNVLNIIADIMY